MSSVARIAATAASLTTHVATAPCFRRGRLLPKMSGCGSDGLARGARGRFAAGRLFPRGLYAAGRDRSDRLPEQGVHLRPTVPHEWDDAKNDRCVRDRGFGFADILPAFLDPN